MWKMNLGESPLPCSVYDLTGEKNEAYVHSPFSRFFCLHQLLNGSVYLVYVSAAIIAYYRVMWPHYCWCRAR